MGAPADDRSGPSGRVGQGRSCIFLLPGMSAKRSWKRSRRSGEESRTGHLRGDPYDVLPVVLQFFMSPDEPESKRHGGTGIEVNVPHTQYGRDGRSVGAVEPVVR